MIVGFIWFLGFLSLIALTGLQFYVITLISDFEVSNLNPLESSSTLSHTTKPTIIVFFFSIFTFIFTLRYNWLPTILQGAVGYFFYTNLNDKKQWFEPRYLFRDLKKIKMRHGVLLIVSAASAIISLLFFILKK